MTCSNLSPHRRVKLSRALDWASTSRESVLPLLLSVCVLWCTQIGCRQQPAEETEVKEVTVEFDETPTAPPPEAKTTEPPTQSTNTATASSAAADSGQQVPTTAPKLQLTFDPQQVVLGSKELFAGIPGTGDLTTAQIAAWLDLPAVHELIVPNLPLGMSAASAAIQGVDQNPLTLAKIELGRQLYFDTRLSSDNTISCASCHDPHFGWAKDTQFGVGVEGQMGNRNSPVSFNRIVSGAQFWDGRAASLEEQAVGPIANPIEMGNTHEKAVQTVASIEGYRLQFDRIFPGQGVTIDNIGKAIATFERAVVSGPAPYDYLEQLRNIENNYDQDEIADLEEDDPELYQQYAMAKQQVEKMSEAAIRGRDLFFSEKANCTACHAGANFSDEQYHNIGVGMESAEPDLGRYAQTKDEKDMGAFKTPTCRNVADSGPYMHDGSQKTLEEVIEWYDKGGHANPHLSDKMKKLALTQDEKTELVAFLREGLHGTLPPVESGRLPQ